VTGSRFIRFSTNIGFLLGPSRSRRSFADDGLTPGPIA